jgi:uncharacterized glyoxalase superfamily protein PhnB
MAKKKAKASRTKKSSTKAAAKSAKKNSARRSAAKPARAAKSTPAAKAVKGFQLASLAPSLTVNDVTQSLAWYCDVLGFVVKQRWERDGKLTGAEIAAGPVALYMSQEDGQQGERVKGQGFRLYLYSRQDIDQLANGIKARGGTLASEPKDEWGTRYFNLVDPTGYKITIGSER